MEDAPAMERDLRNRNTTDKEVRRNGADKSERMDLGLALLSALREPGFEYDRRDLAAWMGCTDETVRLLENRALKRVRKMLGVTVNQD